MTALARRAWEWRAELHACRAVGVLTLTRDFGGVARDQFLLQDGVVTAIWCGEKMAENRRHFEAHLYRSDRLGLTLVELLVVIAIIGILIGITLPAVQMAREASRRTVCQNNLRQLGLALQQFHGTHDQFPVNVGPYVVDNADLQLDLNGTGWIFRILPYLEQQNLYDRFKPAHQGDFLSDGGLKRPELRSLVQVQLPVLHCPSDGSALDLSETQYQWEGIPVATTNYKGVLGDTQIGGALSLHTGSLPDCHNDGGCNGLFYRRTFREPKRLSDVQDGASRTFMVGEDVPEQNDHSAAFYANGDYSSTHVPLNHFPDTPKDWPNVMSFRSYHSGGAFFCMVDGSVRFVSDHMDHPIYRALSTRAGRETGADLDSQ